MPWLHLFIISFYQEGEVWLKFEGPILVHHQFFSYYKLAHTIICWSACRNYTNPTIKGAVVFHTQGPQMFDYSIRLNHTWAFSGFPNVKSIMDVNGPYLNDLQLGVNVIPIMQYGFSGFLTVWPQFSL